MNKLSRRKVLAAAVAVSACLPFGAAHALTATGTFNVTVTLANFCTVSAANVGFGTINAGVAATNTANNITLTCNKGVTFVSLFLNNGLQPSGTIKQMANGAERLQYNIDVPTGATLNTCPAAGTNEWNTTTGPAAATVTSLFAAAGGAKTMPICASIPVAQYPAAGLYTDTVTITATYN
jgi:spore coat protein U-like protein